MRPLFFFALALSFAPLARAAPTTLTTFSLGEMPENLAIDEATGDIYVSMLFANPNGGEVMRFDSDGGFIDEYEFPSGTIQAGGLVFNNNSGLLYAVAGGSAAVNGVWVIDPSTGSLTKHGTIPLVLGLLSGPNGMTSDASGNLFVADSLWGYIWKVPSSGSLPRTATLWKNLNAPSLGIVPGPNGVKFGPDGALYVSISDQFKIVRIVVNGNGTAGTTTTHFQQLITFTPADFCFDVEGNIYAGTEVLNQLVKITPEGEYSVLADLDDGLQNTTAALFGRTEDDLENIYVTNASIPSLPNPGSLMTMPIGIEGFPVADW